MAPLVHALEGQYEDQINFIYLDIDDPANDFFKEELRYRDQPHFFLLDEDGQIIKQWIGYVLMGDFVDAFDAALP